MEAESVGGGIRKRLGRMGFFMPVVIFFAFVCVAMTVSMGVSYYRNARMLENNIRENAERLTYQVKSAVDKRFEMAIKKIYDYTYDKEIRGFIPYSDFFSPDAILSAKGIINYNESTFITWEDIRDILVYFPKSGVLLNHDTYFFPDAYFESQLAPKGFDRAQWDGAMGEYSRFGFLTSRRANEDIFVTSAITGADKSQLEAVVAVRLDSAGILKNLTSINTLSRMELYVLDEHGRIVMTSRPDDAPVLEHEKMTGGFGLFYQSVGGVSCLVTYAASAYNGWNYATVTPVEVVMRDVNQSRSMAFTIVGLFLLIAAVSFFYARKMTYHPVSRLLLRIRSSSAEAEEGGDDIRAVNHVLDRMFKERERIMLSMEQQKPIMLNSRLLALINQTEDAAELVDDLEALGVRFQRSHFAVICADIEKTPGFAEDPIQDSMLAKLIIANISSDIFKIAGDVYPVEAARGKVVLLLNLDDAPHADSGILQCAQELLDLLQSTFGVDATIGVSRIGQGAEVLHELYAQAVEALAYKFVSGTASVNRYAEKEFQAEQYYYPPHAEQSLVNFVSVGDHEKAFELLRTIFDRNFKQSKHPAMYSRCLFFDITSTILKLLGEMKVQAGEVFGEGFSLEKEVLDCATADEAYEVLSNMIAEICAYARDRQKSRSYDLLERITAHIGEGYTDSQLCIASIADAVGITQNYLSHYFKEKMGSSVMRYIERLRVNKAKELLSATDLTLSDVAEKTGFTNSAALIRVFKKNEGITPGQYRSM